MDFNWPIVGHGNIVNYLEACLRRGKLSHAYLFSGPAKVGKTSVADYFINSLLCVGEKGEKPCGHCPVCRQIEKKIHPDILCLQREEEKKDIAIGQIQQLRQFLSLSTFLGNYKIAIIKEAEFLNKEAANCLLKTLEEPHKNVIIILISSRIDQLPQTIISRCQQLRFLLVSKKEIADFLQEKYNLSDQEAREAAILSQGKPGKAIDFLDDPSLLEDYKKEARIYATLFKNDLADNFDLINQIIYRKKFVESQKLLRETIFIWFSLVRDIVLIKTNLPHLISNFFIEKELKKIAVNYSLDKLSLILESIKQSKKYLERNVNPRLVMENLILNFKL